MIEQVRSFNRTVTERIGALQAAYLGGARPLGASRVLWELAAPIDVRELRTRLGLDSGYTSRLLRGLEAEGLVMVSPGTDRRVRQVRLTEAGERERARLDAASDALAGSLLAPLSDHQQAQLVEAMGRVERLLTAGLVEVGEATAREAELCVGAYFAELQARFGLDAAVTLPHDGALMLVARLRERPVGCGALKLDTGDIKRMWVSPEVRGLGVGRRLLGALEARAKAEGLEAVRLETNGTLAEAIALYRSSGYQEVTPFNREPYAHHWFAKRLT